MDSPMVTGTEEKRDRYSELPKRAAHEKTHAQHLTIPPRTHLEGQLREVLAYLRESRQTMELAVRK